MNKSEKIKKFIRERISVRVIAAVLMFLIGVMCLLYPVIAKRYNEWLALKANAEYAEYAVNYDDEGEIVLIP